MNNKIHYVITALGKMSFDLGEGVLYWLAGTPSILCSCLSSTGSQVPTTMTRFYAGSRESCCVANTYWL